MATLTVNAVTRSGVSGALVAATGGGDKFAPDSGTYLRVNNGGAGAITVTIVSTSKVVGLDVADPAVSVPAAADRIIGPFPKEHFANSADGLADITYSGVTSVTVGAFQLVQP